MIKTRFNSLVENDLILVEKKMHSHSSDYHTNLQQALDHLIASGGKRLRPVLALLVGKMLGADTERVITLAAAIELLHTATLVHDDLIDGSLLRRGIPTLNSEWSPAATVLAGDFIFARAAELAAETESIDVMKIFARTLSTIVTGEINQLFSRKRVANRQEYYKRINAKTASMFVLATKATALLSEANGEVIHNMEVYGYHVGMAFQIVDDILDFTGEQVTVGKPVASDLRQGIITLPAIYYNELHPDDENMQAVLDGNFYNDLLMTNLINSIRNSDVIEKSMNEARNFIEKGVDTISEFPFSAERDALIDFAEYVVDRDI